MPEADKDQQISDLLFSAAAQSMPQMPNWKQRAETAEAALARLTAQVETLQGELETATANFHGYVELLERADAAEAQVTELQGLLNTATTLAATHFDRANAAETQVTALRALLEPLRHCLVFECQCGDQFDSVEHFGEHVATVHNEDGEITT